MTLLFMSVLLAAACSSQTNNTPDQPISASSNTQTDESVVGGDEAPAVSGSSEETVKKHVYLEPMSITTPVSPGSAVTLFVRTRPGVTCEVKVGYPAGAEEAKALLPKQTNETGLVSWTWNVDPSVAFGTYPVTITGKDISGNEGTTTTEIEIKSAEACNK